MKVRLDRTLKEANIVSQENLSEIRKGTRVVTTGQGRTATWETYKGTVTMRSGNSVFVKWDSSVVEDELDIKEVKILKEE